MYDTVESIISFLHLIKIIITQQSEKNYSILSKVQKNRDNPVAFMLVRFFFPAGPWTIVVERIILFKEKKMENGFT